MLAKKCKKRLTGHPKMSRNLSSSHTYIGAHVVYKHVLFYATNFYESASYSHRVNRYHRLLCTGSMSTDSMWNPCKEMHKHTSSHFLQSTMNIGISHLFHFYNTDHRLTVYVCYIMYKLLTILTPKISYTGNRIPVEERMFL